MVKYLYWKDYDPVPDGGTTGQVLAKKSNTDADTEWITPESVATHEAASDPHPQYLTTAEGNAAYDSAGAASSAVTTHEAASNPHPVYLTQAEGDSLYATTGHSHSGLAPTGGTTGQVLKKQSNTNYDYAWDTDQSGGTAAWGGITGTLSNQSDLQTALDGKAASSHTHTLADISDEGALASKNTIATGDLDNDAVTYAKIQDVSATDRLLGRSTAGAGIIEEVVCTAAGRALLDDVDAAAQRTTLGAAASSHTHTLADITDEGALASKNTIATTDIDNDAVTYAKIQNVSATDRFLGRKTAGAGDIEELTGTEATARLDTFTSGAKGLVPASGGGTTNFLRADGTFAAPTAAAADPTYSPGSFTVVTETQRLAPHRLQMTTSQRITIEGTGRLSCLN